MKLNPKQLPMDLAWVFGGSGNGFTPYAFLIDPAPRECRRNVRTSLLVIGLSAKMETSKAAKALKNHVELSIALKRSTRNRRHDLPLLTVQ